MTTTAQQQGKRDLEELKAEAKKINGVIAKIEDAERRELNAGFVGKYFRYQNNYSVPSKPSDYWPLYCKVESMDDNGMLNLCEFETDKYGTITIRFSRSNWCLTSGYTEISKGKFLVALKRMKRRVSEFRP